MSRHGLTPLEREDGLPHPHPPRPCRRGVAYGAGRGDGPRSPEGGAAPGRSVEAPRLGEADLRGEDGRALGNARADSSRTAPADGGRCGDSRGSRGGPRRRDARARDPPQRLRRRRRGLHGRRRRREGRRRAGPSADASSRHRPPGLARLARTAARAEARGALPDALRPVRRRGGAPRRPRAASSRPGRAG
ncbi:MAG: hypothetical protein MZU79_06510 [Anaerotruncus sp.]|nr:hypothetical protein [Anaerotruncus sp.]